MGILYYTTLLLEQQRETDSNNRSRKQALCKQIKIDGIDG